MGLSDNTQKKREAKAKEGEANWREEELMVREKEEKHG